MFDELYEQIVGLHSQAMALYSQVEILCTRHSQFDDVRKSLSDVATILGCAIMVLDRIKNDNNPRTKKK